MQLPTVFGPAAGWIKTVKQVRDICREPNITHVTLGSFTLDQRNGNVGGTQFSTRPDGASINAMGLPNAGLRTICADDTLLEMCKLLRAAGKEVIVSIAEFSPAGYAEAVSLVLAAAGEYIDVLEINCGCPNAFGVNGKHPIVSLDLHSLEIVIDSVNCCGNRHMVNVWYKMSPHVDQNFRADAAKLLAPYADGLVLCNTIPDGHWRKRSGKTVLDVANGYGGVAGAALLELSLINLEGYNRALTTLGARNPDNYIVLIGAGGVSRGDHVTRYMQAGADGVVIGTAFFEGEDPRIFGTIVAEHMGVDQQ